MRDSGNRTLLPQHRGLLEASAIAPEVAAARGYFSATDHSQLEALGFRPYQALVPTLVVPVHDVTGKVAMHQSRPDRPRVTDAGREMKYETPAGTRLALDVPPAARERLRDPKVPLWITEGARKADSAVSAGLCCIALLGVWGWRGTNEHDGKTALADWDSIALNDREVFLAFDSDVMTKNSVELALLGLRRFIAKRGARVRCVYLPSENGEKVGLDDYLAVGHSVDDLLACAEPPRQTEQRDTKPPTKLEREVNELVESVLGQLLPSPSDGTTASLLFHTPAREPYAVVTPNDVLQTHSIRSSAFRTFLAASYYEEKKKAPSSEALMQARLVLEGKALFDGPEQEVFTRIGRGRDGAIYLDLCDPQWRVVRIDAAGWNVVTRSPVRFRRAGGMLALPAPQRGGSLADLRQFVNVASDADFCLLVGWLLGAVRAAGPYLVLVFVAEQGSGKSTTSRVLRRLIDPNKADLRSQPKEPRDLAIACNNSWVSAFDNLSSIAPWLSDGLCRVATGGGFATRQLYSDDAEAIFDVQRPILLNGIDSVAERGDLLDRAILIHLPRLQNVRTEAELWRDFDAARPRLLGALLDAASVALRREESVKLEQRVRMADAARWIVAGEPALPWEEGQFLKAYVGNRADANETALEASAVAAILMAYIKTAKEWTGTPTELLGELEGRAEDKTKRLKTWPSSPKTLSADLRRLAPNLRAAGVEIEFGRTGGKGSRRWVRLLWTGPESSVTHVTSVTAEPEDAGDGSAGPEVVTHGDAGETHGDAAETRATPRRNGAGDEGDAGDARVPILPDGSGTEYFEW